MRQRQMRRPHAQLETNRHERTKQRTVDMSAFSLPNQPLHALQALVVVSQGERLVGRRHGQARRRRRGRRPPLGAVQQAAGRAKGHDGVAERGLLVERLHHLALPRGPGRGADNIVDEPVAERVQVRHVLLGQAGESDRGGRLEEMRDCEGGFEFE